MARWSDIAEWRGPTANVGGAMVEQRGLVIHIAEGTYEGTIAWQKNPTASVSSHFVVGKDGHIAQVVDTATTAWTQRAGNGHWLSVENEGYSTGPLTPAQVEANARLLAYGHKALGWPLQLATSPSGRGLGHHSMGAESGVDWGHSECPGVKIKAQKPAILARAIAIVNGTTATTGDNDMGQLTDAPNDPQGQMFHNIYGWLFDFLGEQRLVNTAVQERLTNLTTGGVDLDALADKVADKLAARLKD